MNIAAAADHRERDDRRPGGHTLATPGPVLGDLTAELVPEDDPLVGAHEGVVAGLVEHLGKLVAVVAGVQVGAADAATQDVEHDLAPLRAGIRQVDE